MGTTPNIERAVAQAAAYVQAVWQQTVMGTLQVPGAKTPQVNIGLRQLYADSIVTSKMLIGQGSASMTVLALKKIAEELENGKGPWDMKPMLLGGPKVRVGKNGKYNIIPFRHGTSSQYSPNSNFKPMPTDIYQAARTLKASVRQGNGMKWGGRLTGTETQHPPGQNPTSGYQHKSGRYEGMVRIEKTYAKATQNKYMTFRVVSSNSDPASWWHPGYQPHKIAEGVANYCRPAIEDMIRIGAEQDLVDAIASINVGQ